MFFDGFGVENQNVSLKGLIEIKIFQVILSSFHFFKLNVREFLLDGFRVNQKAISFFGLIIRGNILVKLIPTRHFFEIEIGHVGFELCRI